MKAVFLSLIWVFTITAQSFAAPSLTDPTLKIEEVVSGLNAPTTMAFIGADDMLVLEKYSGWVRRVIGGVLQSELVLDADVAPDSERGLLGIAVHPEFATNRFVYLFYTEAGHFAFGNDVYRYTWDGTTNTLTNPELILHLPVTPGPNHNGGVITFGPDGKLYVIIGDLNRNGRLQNVSRGARPDDTSVILRINDDGTVPADNPFFALGDPVNKYYAYGIRNSFGMTFDPITDKLWDTENGPDVYDEINLVEPGFNSGWKKIMGPNSRDPQNLGSLVSFRGAHYADPKFSWRNPVGVTAMVFFNSPGLGGQYENDIIVGDFNNGNLYCFVPNAARDGLAFFTPGLADRVADNPGEFDEVIFGTGFDPITDLKVGPDGLLYVVSFFGKIYRISRQSPPLLYLNTPSLPDGEVGATYHAGLEIGGGTPPYTVSAVGPLPSWMTLVPNELNGTPDRPDKLVLTLQVADDAGASVNRQFQIWVHKAVGIANNRLIAGRVNRNYRARLRGAGGKKPYSWSLISGTLPNGLTLNQSTGLITGVPTAAVRSSLTFEITDPLGGSEQKTFALAINP